MIAELKDAFVEKVDDFVKRHNVLEEHSTIVVGVSGGPDSLGSFILFVREKGREEIGNCSGACGPYV